MTKEQHRIGKHLKNYFRYFNRKTLSPKLIFNRKLLKLSILARKTRCWGKPAHIRIELTNVCNLSCVMCPQGGLNLMKRKKGFMEFSTFKKIVDQSLPYNEFTYLHVWGESLLHKDLPKMIAYLKKKGVDVGLSTNVTLLTKEKSKELINAGLDFLILSLDGDTKETYERIRRNADWEKVLKNVEDYFNAKDELKKKGVKTPFTVIQMIRMVKNEESIGTYNKFWDKFGADSILVKRFWDWAGQSEEVKKFGEKYAKKKRQRPCHALWHHLVFAWDGTAVPCCNDFNNNLNLGNINKESLAEIWNGKKMMALRKLHLEGKRAMVPCNTCALESPKLFSLRTLTDVLADGLTFEKMGFSGE